MLFPALVTWIWQRRLNWKITLYPTFWSRLQACPELFLNSFNIWFSTTSIITWYDIQLDSYQLSYLFVGTTSWLVSILKATMQHMKIIALLLFTMLLISGANSQKVSEIFSKAGGFKVSLLNETCSYPCVETSRWSICCLKFFSWLLDHVIYLKLTLWCFGSMLT